MDFDDKIDPLAKDLFESKLSTINEIDSLSDKFSDFGTTTYRGESSSIMNRDNDDIMSTKSKILQNKSNKCFFFFMILHSNKKAQ